MAAARKPVEDSLPDRTLAFSYAAVLAADGKTSIGTAFLVDRTRALTCAHVVHEALGRDGPFAGSPRPDEPIILRFPQLPNRPDVKATVTDWFAALEDDFALLELPPEGVEGGVPVQTSIDAEEKESLRTFGFPRGSWYGVSLDGKVHTVGRGSRLLVAIDEASLIGVSGGYSGAPVWSPRASAVIGMIATAVTEQPRLASAVPMSLILPRLRSLSVAPGLRSRVRSAFEAPKNLPRAKTLKGLVATGIQQAKWRNGWLPDEGYAVEVAEEGDISVPWFSCWSSTHPLNVDYPDDGDLFFTVSLRPTGRPSPRNVCEVALVWSGRGVGSSFEEYVTRAEARQYLRQALEDFLTAEDVRDVNAQPSEWYGVEMAGLLFFDVTIDAALAGRVVDLMKRQADLFQRFLTATEADLGASLHAAETPKPARKARRPKPGAG